jgi:hypothetical protein
MCVTVLLVALVKYDQSPNSDIADFLIWCMLVLTAPSGILILLLNAGFAYVLYIVFTITISTTYLTLSLTWLLFFVIGYVQWFYLLPRIRSIKGLDTFF